MSEWISVDASKPGNRECVDIWLEMPDGDRGRLTDCYYEDANNRYWKWVNEGRKKGFIDACYVTHYMTLPNEPEKNGALRNFGKLK